MDWTNYTPGQAWNLPAGFAGVETPFGRGAIAEYMLAHGYSGSPSEMPDLSQFDLSEGNPNYAQEAARLNAFLNGGSGSIPSSIDDWLRQNGLSARAGRNDLGGGLWDEHVQLVDGSGNVVANDQHTYGKRDNAALAAALLPLAVGGGLAAMGYNVGAGTGFGVGAGSMAGGAGAGSALGAAGAAGAGTLGAGATGAGITTQGIGAAELAGLGLSNPGMLTAIPGTFDAALAAGGAGSVLGGAGAAAGSTLGAGVATPTVTTPGLPSGVTSGLGLSNPGALTGAAPTVGGGILSGLANSGIGQAVGQVADLVGGGSNLAGIIGGIAGAASGSGGGDTITNQNRMDPRMDAFVYGTGQNDPNSLLGSARQWFDQNKTGMNADMTAGLGLLRNLYNSPEYSQGYNQMRQTGLGLLNTAPAGNPFTSGLLNLPSFSLSARPNRGG